MSAPMKPRRKWPHLFSQRRSQRGLTLVELLVALALSTLVVIAAVSALIVSRRGFNTVDAASQLRDNARFASDMIQRLGVQAGYEDTKYLTTPTDRGANPATNISGFNNSTASLTDPAGTATPRVAGSVGDGSDILILRFQAGETFPGSGVADNTMIDCAGKPSSAIPSDANDRQLSVFYVDIQDGEPTLMCLSNATPPLTGFTATPLVRGVENFQVLYGLAPATAVDPDALDVPDRFLRADQMVVSGDSAATNVNWRRIRSLRIGLVLRGPLGSSQDSSSQTFYPLGKAIGSTGGAVGSALSSSADQKTVFTPSPPDTRLRQAVTFTVHLRNDQGLQ